MRQNFILLLGISFAMICLNAGVASAQCTLPNNLTNGQTADATQVMGDFAAVVACLETLNPGGSVNSLQLNAGGGQFGGLALTDGQLAIGSSTGAPQAATLTPGAGISISNGAGSITISATGVTGGLIATQVADGTASSITFSSITQQYRDLVLIITGQSVNAAQDVISYVDGDTNNSDYRNSTWNQFGTGSVAAPRIGTFPGEGVPSAGGAAQIVTQYFNYAGSNWLKYANSDGEYEDTGNFFRMIMQWKWNNTAPITSITLLVQSGNIASGTIFSLYGR